MVDMIKRYFFNKQYEKVRAISDKTKGTNRLQSVTILAEHPTYTTDDLKKAMNFFKKKDLECDGFMVVTELTEQTDNSIQYISKKDCYWYDIPKQEVLIHWLQHKTDLLMVIDPNGSRIMKYLCASSNSLLKSAVAFDNDCEENIDFYLEPNSKQSTIYDLTAALYTELIRIHKN